MPLPLIAVTFVGAMRAVVVAIALLPSLATAVPTQVAIGSDAYGVGRAFVPIDPAGTATLLGDGSVAFDGGLAFRPSDERTYAIANDRFGASTLVGFAANPPASAISSVAIGSGFLDGLALDPKTDAFYAIASDPAARSTLHRIDALDNVTGLGFPGFGFFGGLTFDASDGLLYAIAGDALGIPRRVERIDALAATASATTLFDLGTSDTAFNGGLLYDAARNDFLVIANDADGNSRLDAFDLARTLVDLAKPLGTDFLDAGLALVDLDASGDGGGNTAGEPSTVSLLFVALLLIVRAAAPRSSASDTTHSTRKIR